MRRARANARLIKIHFSYSVDEIARTLGVHKNTVRSWLKGGLPRVDSGRPTLVQGRDLRAFLDKRRKASKTRCAPGTLFCLKCRAPRSPAYDMLDYIPFTATSGNLRALCSACGTLMHRQVQRSRIGAVMPGLSVQVQRADPHIRECTVPSLNCDTGKDKDAHVKTQRR